MTMQHFIPSLRPDDLAGHYAPPTSDYPVRLLTRRVYALSEAQISAVRGIAPQRVLSRGGAGSLRPPC
jgi:hypothetical protein